LPILQSEFQPYYSIFRNTHVSTIYASLIRRWIPKVTFQRERIDTPDGDFLDLDWSQNGSKKLVVILAGLEGKSNSLYSRSAIRYFNKNGWDALAMNYRGCSGEPNRNLRGYHMGASDDVKLTINYILENYSYEEIVIVGFSLGGNLALKYVGEEGERLPQEIIATVSFSVPMDIQASDERLNRWYNWHYLKWFMLPLNYKANRKKKQFPVALKKYNGFFMSGNFVYFDTHFTAPANGFDDVVTYWESSSCIPVLGNVKIPSLIVSSIDDTFISKNCYPYEVAEKNKNIFLELPNYGGHCGFIRRFFEKSGWMEERALAFLENEI
jgi:predicted alpha/beta-fold hydrolase